MKNFVFDIPTKIHFGTKAIHNIGSLVAEHSKRVLITFGSSRIKTNGLLDQITKQLTDSGIEYKEFSGIQANPRITSVRDGIAIMKEHQLDFVLAVGGGSVIDASKAIAAGAASEIDPWLFCTRKEAIKNAYPVASVLTLSATGSEMNGNAVLSNVDTQEKLAMSSPLLLPVFSILDPSLTFSVPKNQTAAGVVDIFTHVAELYFQPQAEAGVSDRISEAIMKTCIDYGHVALEEPENYEARANLMWAGSMALNGMLNYGKSGGDWATHGIEHELSAAYDITHGVGLAIVLPQWMEYTLNADTQERYAMFAKNVWSIEKEDILEQAKAGIAATKEYFASLGVATSLSEIGLDSSLAEHMATQATQFGAIGALKSLQKNDVQLILEKCI